MAAAAQALRVAPDPLLPVASRARALLARQSIEAALADLWAKRAPGMRECSLRAQLLCLPWFLGDVPLAKDVAYAWAALSRVCHHHAYELAPLPAELDGFVALAGRLAAKVGE